jgi:hypothetical protein
MFKLEVFESKVKDANFHFEWFKKSSLHELIELLKDKTPSPTRGQELRNALDRIPQKKRERYRNAIGYLKTTHPAFSGDLMSRFVAVGQTSNSYQPGKFYRHKDMIGRWHDFVMQEKGNSCGCAVVRIVKAAHYPQEKSKLGEKEIQGLIAQIETGRTHQGLTSKQTETLHDWDNVGSNPHPLVEALRSPPAPVKNARAVYMSAARMRAELARSSPKQPAIVGWWWKGGAGGHWTVCAGLATPDKLVILDPWNGVQYVDNTNSGFNAYQVIGESGIEAEGEFDPNDPADIAVILTT